MLIIEDRIWAGSETSLQAASQAEANIATKMTAGGFQDDEDEDEPRLLSIEDGLATIAIKGPLVNSDSPYLQFFGVTGYPEIRDALVSAAQNTEVKQILLDVDSGGGAVSGVADTAALIRNINDNVKPVSTYTDGVMASAAYWLGSSAGEVYAGKTAMVGSIGVIATHKEFSEAYKMEGVGVTVIRAGKEKALANSNEKLSEKGKAQIQQMVDASYEVFVDHVATMRGKSFEYADKTMADGQEFIGKAASDVGLVDGISTFDAVVSDLKEKIIATSENLMHNRGKGAGGLMGNSTNSLSGEATMARKALSEQEVAALAAGAALEATTDAPTTEAPAAEEGAPETKPEGTQDGVQNEGQEASEEVAAKVDTVSETVQLLNSQLKAKDDALLQAGIKTAKLEEQLAEAQATHAPLLEIAAKSLGNMQIALGGSALSVEGMSAANLIAEHKRFTEQFQTKFPVGGVSAAPEAGVSKNERAASDALTQARLSAVRFSK